MGEAPRDQRSAPPEHSGEVPGEAGEAFAELVRIMDRLRSEEGDAWVRAQTHGSLVRYLLEESHEVLEAIEAEGGVDRVLLREELGDLLLQVLFHARLAQEADPSQGRFDVVDVLRDQARKQVRRHPETFAGARPPEGPAADLEELTRRWDALKREEKPGRTGPFDGIPPSLPALARAEKSVNKAAKAGLPLPPAVSFGREDLDRDGAGLSPESVTASEQGERDEQAVGEILLGLVVSSRRLGVDPERALRRAVREYQRRAVAEVDAPRCPGRTAEHPWPEEPASDQGREGPYSP